MTLGKTLDRNELKQVINPEDRKGFSDMRFVCSLIVVENIERSRNFYENVLGQKVKNDFGENVSFEGEFAIHLRSHYQNLLGDEHRISLNGGNNSELYFETDDIEKDFTKLRESGVVFVHEIREQPWGQRVVRFYDPDSHIIEIGEMMEKVVVRLRNQGLTAEEVSRKSNMSAEFVDNVLRSV